VRICVREFAAVKHDGAWFKRNLDGSLDLKARVVCSAGTYVRTLAEDFGKRLGLGAHLAELRRTRVGPFRIEHAHSLEQIEAAVAAGSLDQLTVSANDALSHLIGLELSAAEIQRVRNGIRLEPEAFDCTDGQYIRLRDSSGELVAVAAAHWESERLFLQPQVVFPETSK
jgi:tRNA pseudouridine55 synthase